MALVIDISENADKIRQYGAQRIGEKKQGWNEYQIYRRVIKNGTIFNEYESMGRISHKYEDGADVLAFKVLKFISEQEPTVEIPRLEKKGIRKG
jgi:hypothetical protein